DDTASRPREDPGRYRVAAPARSLERRIPRISEGSAEPARTRRQSPIRRACRQWRNVMTTVSRRHYLAAIGALLTAAFAPRAALAQTTIRQGYQTNLWGMPTYYLLRSGLLEKHGIKFEEFGVPSGNLTMQQMVGRQVDLGTYAGPSLILGHDKGGLVAIAQIENVGKTAGVLVRKDLNLTKIEEIKVLNIDNHNGLYVL